DRDGNLDLAVTIEGGYVAIYLGDGNGNFPGGHGLVRVQYVPTAIVASDLNRDGFPDRAGANSQPGTRPVCLGDGTGAFTDAPGSPRALDSAPVSIVAADFNHDGHPDLAVANYPSGAISVLLGDGHGEFSDAPGSPLPVGPHPQSIAAGDFNRDGNA